jgi:cation diffusion facilitator CzcD-associated flavoprotein CzcO
MAYWLQRKSPNKRYTILEARDSLGGTWDLFRYPGIRSDSDMFTFGYRFRPWKDPRSLSDGPSILKYLNETAVENGIDKKIRYGHKVIRASWSGKERQWQLDVQHNGTTTSINARFLCMCSGYYNYKEAYRPHFEGEENFEGRIVLPQFWPQDLDYKGKRVVIIGSGATAVTLVPAMAETAAHVTMLQRSPTYIMNLPNHDGLFQFLRKFLPNKLAFSIIRRRNLLLSITMFSLMRTFPKQTKKFIMRQAAKQLPPGFDVEKHFNPRYNPWDQRLCVVPDGDLFQSISKGSASVVTDEIANFTKGGIRLRSGEELEADIIVMATGLKIHLLGGAEMLVDGEPIKPTESMIYKGMMISDVPNMAIAFGYTNASWTLKADLTSNYVCKLLNYMDRKGYSMVVAEKKEGVDPEPLMNFTSGYVQRAMDVLPKQGSKRPWRVYQNYFMDMLTTRYGRTADGVLKFFKSSAL